jgi:hypothetical protein
MALPAYRTVLTVALLVTFLIAPTPRAQASHQFEDVPDSSPYHDEIGWLVNAGVTTGCSVTPPLYCPQTAVTREQMAVFLKKSAISYQVIDSNGHMVGRTLSFTANSATVVFSWRGTTHWAEVNVNGFVPRRAVLLSRQPDVRRPALCRIGRDRVDQRLRPGRDEPLLHRPDGRRVREGVAADHRARWH